MKTNRFLSFMAVSAVFLTLFASNSIGAEAYLGVGYDVIKSGYINSGATKKQFPVLDKEKMVKAAIIDSQKINNEQKFETAAGSSIKEFYQKRNSNINVDYGGGISGFFFSGNFNAEFEKAENEQNKESAFYARLRTSRYIRQIWIKEPSASNLSNYLKESFKTDLQKLNPSNFLDRYGTHIFIGYYKGGSLEANYTYTGTEYNSTDKIKEVVEASFAGIKASAGTSKGQNTTEIGKDMSFKYLVYGGKELPSHDWEGLKKGYGEWVKSIDTKADICGIPENFSDGLMPIWELAETIDPAKAAALKTEFQKRAKEQGEKLPGRLVYTQADPINITAAPISMSHLNARNITLKPPKGSTIAEIEIYALGAGGGGQGGNLMFPITSIRGVHGTGGSGGGGSVAYLKL